MTSTAELDYHALNAMLNLYDADGKIQLDADQKATRAYFEQHVVPSTVTFDSLEAKLDYSVRAGYYEAEGLEAYTPQFRQRIWDFAAAQDRQSTRLNSSHV